MNMFKSTKLAALVGLGMLLTVTSGAVGSSLPRRRLAAEYTNQEVEGLLRQMVGQSSVTRRRLAERSIRRRLVFGLFKKKKKKAQAKAKSPKPAAVISEPTVARSQMAAPSAFKQGQLVKMRLNPGMMFQGKVRIKKVLPAPGAYYVEYLDKHKEWKTYENIVFGDSLIRVQTVSSLHKVHDEVQLTQKGIAQLEKRAADAENLFKQLPERLRQAEPPMRTLVNKAKNHTVKGVIDEVLHGAYRITFKWPERMEGYQVNLTGDDTIQKITPGAVPSRSGERSPSRSPVTRSPVTTNVPKEYLTPIEFEMNPDKNSSISTKASALARDLKINFQNEGFEEEIKNLGRGEADHDRNIFYGSRKEGEEWIVKTHQLNKYWYVIKNPKFCYDITNQKWCYLDGGNIYVFRRATGAWKLK